MAYYIPGLLTVRTGGLTRGRYKENIAVLKLFERQLNCIIVVLVNNDVNYYLFKINKN